ncbi:MAG TPA: thioredoxin domain-containing protein, partial [bacterium]|nr:thioredoxin domain-containing protein [bacterium]
NILHLKAGLSQSLKEIGKDVQWWEGARAKVLAERSKRVRPHLDDKILTAWNSLMISSLALGYQVLGNVEYLAAAEKASSFLAKNLFKDGRLLASYRKGPSDIQGYIDDYAFFQACQLDLYESTFNTAYLKKAIELEKDMVRFFGDEKAGGFYFTGNDQKDQHRLLTRTKEGYDGVIPSGNSVAALSYYRLAEFTGKKEYRSRADAILKCYAGALAKAGPNFPEMLRAFQFDFDGPAEIFVVGSRKESEKMLRLFWKAYLPNRVLAFAEDSQVKELASLLPWVENRASQGGQATAYVCRDYQCQLPTTDPQKAVESLSKP